jgi:hypothetical protein
MTGTGSTTRRKLLTATTTAGSLALSGCLTSSNLSRLVNGPEINAQGLPHSKVFRNISAAETFAFGHIVSASVSVTRAAIYELGVTELEVFANGERPYSASTAPSTVGPKRKKVSVTVQLPVDDTAIITATNENNTPIESIRVMTGGAPIFTGQPLKHKRKPMQEPIPKILKSTLQTEQTQFSANAAVSGTIKNTSNTELLTHLVVKAEFVDEGGTVVDTSFESIRNFSPDEIWEAAVPALGDASKVESATLSIETAVTGVEPVPPTNITLLEETFETPESDLEPPKVIGRIENTGTEELPYLEADAKFYAENGNLLGDATDSVTGLDPNQVWEFNVEFAAYSNEIADRVDSFEVTFVT